MPRHPIDWSSRLQSEHQIAKSNIWCPENPNIVGIDEVGRGALAGPIVAAAAAIDMQCIPLNYRDYLRDSKKLSAQQRLIMYRYIRRCARYAVAAVSVADIDQLNILQASLKAMQCAYIKLGHQSSDFLLVDGNQMPHWQHPAQTIVRGDDLCPSIAAASIIAKVVRDRLMRRLAQDYPAYGWETNMGYGTLQHRTAITRHGITPWHRKSFRLQRHS